MNKFISIPLFFLFGLCSCAQNTENATIKLSDTMLMHEMRATPFPQNDAIVRDRAVSFQWPLPEKLNILRSGLDGAPDEAPQMKIDKSKLRYQLRYSQTPTFEPENTRQVETRWPFFNPEEDLAPGRWYWQYGYIEDGETRWSDTQQFSVESNPHKFCPPALSVALKNLPAHHPRVWLDKNDWDNFIKRSEGKPERNTYLRLADRVLSTPMKSVNDINSDLAKGLANEVQKKAMLTRESRRIIDGEEANTDVLIRAYLLTKERRYAKEAVKRVKEMATWGDNKNVVGDFNEATLLSLCSMAYDALYNELDAETRKFLLNKIRESGNAMYMHNINRLENHIADNHVWQMTFRILTMAAFTAYNELPEASDWADYCYNLWLARFPGLNKDGGWHNGDSYFHVNLRTLVEVPYFYTRLTGYDFFSDPWYQGNALYVIYQQPPFSKSGGNGSSHQNILTPSGTRVGYADALARMTGNTYAADYVRTIQAAQPNILNQGSTSKAGGLAWFRLQCEKPLPVGAGLKELPMGHVFPQSGLASFSTHLDSTSKSAMLSFRSSPYGSTSHALANQNAFNTFWNGQPLFYSSGHHVNFTDKHAVYCHRGTRGHNTILVNGMGQRIGTEGYGWIPRHYVGEEICYVAGDASNAYGKVISPLWLLRGKQSDLEYSPENGWDDTGLKTYRRHIITLGKSGYTFIYDELEAEEPVSWSYLLHTIAHPMEVNQETDYVHVRVVNKAKDGESDAFIFTDGALDIITTNQFFVPAVNWLRADEHGNFKPYANHWHFNATSDKEKKYRFATILYTHAKDTDGKTVDSAPLKQKDGSIQVGEWNIKANVSTQGKPSFEVRNTRKKCKASASYKNCGATVIHDGEKKVVLKDEIPELEI